MADLLIPLYFQADPVTVSADDATYTVVSSQVNLGTGVDLTLDDAEKVGTFVSFLCTDSTANATVTFGTAAGGTSFDKITFAATGDSAECIWAEDGWRVVSLHGTAAIA